MELIETKGFEFENEYEMLAYASMNDVNKCKFIKKALSDDVHRMGKNIYVYNTESKLFEPISIDQFNTFLVCYLDATNAPIESVKKEQNSKLIKKCEDDEQRQLLKERLREEMKGFVKTLYNVQKNTIKDFMRGCFFDKEFIEKIEGSDEYIAIADNKKINLKTLKIEKRTKSDYCTFSCKIKYVDKTPHADKFFEQIMPDKKEREYLRKVLGYCLTGEVGEQCFFIFYGSGSNGKSVISNLLQSILSEFYSACHSSIFTLSKNQDHEKNPYLINMIGKRVCVFSEGETADKIEMNESMIKQISGDDTITSRGLYQDPITFKLKSKLMMLTNFVPPINAEKSMIRRLRYIFFDSCFSEKPDLSKKNQFKKDEAFVNNLKTKYLNEVFSWIAKGAQKYYEKMELEMPESFQTRTNELLERGDSIQSFIVNKLTITKNDKDHIRRGDMFKEYQKYCDANSQRCIMRSTLFGRLEQVKGIRNGKLNGYDIYKGIRINALGGDSEDEEDDEDDANDQGIDKTDKSVKSVKAEPKKDNSEMKDILSELKAMRVEMEKLKKENEELKAQTKPLEKKPKKKTVFKNKTVIMKDNKQDDESDIEIDDDNVDKIMLALK